MQKVVKIYTQSQMHNSMLITRTVLIIYNLAVSSVGILIL